MIANLLLDLPSPSVRIVFCPAVAVALAQVEAHANLPPEGVKLVACHWGKLAGIATVIDDALRSLAEAAQGCWPDWYTGEADSSVADAILLEAATEEAVPVQVRHLVLPPWLRQARDCCHQSCLPLPEGFPNATHAAQLSLALAPERLLLVLAVTDSTPAPGALLALARAAEWFAREAGATVAVLLPEALRGHCELDSISFAAMELPLRRPAGEAEEEKSRLFVWPRHGKPHPNSRGEQLLARRLGEEGSELAGLFRFNQSVETCRGSRFLVDLLWPEGRVVIEVDGYRWHSDRETFSGDRHRDYELMISGFLVLRLPHDEVVDDVELALAKIRDVVAFRRRQLFDAQGGNS